MAQHESEDPAKPSWEELDLQPFAPETAAIIRDMTGEERPNPSLVNEPETQVYIVREGDTMEKIAKRFYGDPKKFRIILDANRDRLGDNYELIPGMELLIPPEDRTAGAC